MDEKYNKHDDITEFDMKDLTPFPKYYTVKEVAELLQITEQSVTRYIRLGQIKALQIGWQWRISEAAVHQIFESGIPKKAVSKKPKRRRTHGKKRSGGPAA